MVKIVVGREIPQHRLALDKCVVSEEQIVRFLSLFIKEGVVVITLEAFHHVSRVACPLVNLPVRFHGIYQMRATILYGNGIAMIVIPRTLVMCNSLIVLRKWYSLHMCKKIDGICIVVDRGIADNT